MLLNTIQDSAKFRGVSVEERIWAYFNATEPAWLSGFERALYQIGQLKFLF